METKRSRLISFYELSEEWQKEAISNNDEYAQEAMYFEPEDNMNPNEHVLWDLNECMRQPGKYKDFEYDGVIGISNNTAMLVKLLDDGEEVEYIIV